ncbi:helveticin J family class III bacteriocin [Lactobacillus delbrueckii]|uniref:helveticin J family class III bacteriocin n=1 Tax=Lactobacillus delbrueckii TaxID=1584 RepID=UPI0022E20B93|nr:helveticin J family class III bacteriocin [Lactobacillus delbrueckii]
MGVKKTNTHKNKWDKQIARVDIKAQKGSHSSHLDFPRLAYLNREPCGQSSISRN